MTSFDDKLKELEEAARKAKGFSLTPPDFKTIHFVEVDLLFELLRRYREMKAVVRFYAREHDRYRRATNSLDEVRYEDGQSARKALEMANAPWSEEEK